MAASQDRRLARIVAAQDARERETRRLAHLEAEAELAEKAEAFRERQARREATEATP
jgi:hypothetical protein